MSGTITPPGVGGPAGGPPQGPMPPMAAGGAPPGFPRGPRPPVQGGPGIGGQASGLIKMGQAIRLIQEAMLALPIGSDVHSAAVKAIRDLSRHVPVGPDTQGVQQTAQGDQQRQMIQQALMSAIGGAGGPRPMPPSTPLPGA